MIRAVIWKGSALLAVPDSWKIIEGLRQKRILSLMFFDSDELLPAEIRGMQGSWHSRSYIWKPGKIEPRKHSLAFFTEFLLNERDFNAEHDVIYVGDAPEDVPLARKDQIQPVLVRTGTYDERQTPLGGVPVLPSAQFVPGWIDRENKKAIAADHWDGGPRAA